ncbi:MAG: hypothetical protein JNK37_05860 [Verrucomicrobiales bacterium]|nr:hypothetical protein [Verrucomicrobiales bacterium]
MSEPSPPRGWLRRFSAYGDLTLKFQHWGATVCPPYLEPLYIAFYSGLLFLIGGPVRRGLMANLAVLFPDRGRVRLWLDAYRVVWNFAFSVADGSRSRLGESVIDWEIVVPDRPDRVAAPAGNTGDAAVRPGGIILTAHMGNYDVAATLFAGQFGRRLNAVRAPERHPETQAWMERELAAQGREDLAVLYNRGDHLLGITLVQAIQRGELVAIQGDRVLYDIRPLEVLVSPSGDPARPVRMRLPKGPFVLALATGAPIHPLFAIRVGWRRYRIVELPPFYCRAESRDREAAIVRAATHWAQEVLLPVIREHWEQWFVFEPVFWEENGASKP